MRSGQPDSSGCSDRVHFHWPVRPRLDLWQRTPRSALSRRLGAGRGRRLAALFPHRHEDRPPVDAIRHALAEGPYLCRLSADRSLSLAFGFLSAGHQPRMGVVGDLGSGAADGNFQHPPCLVATRQARDRQAHRLRSHPRPPRRARAGSPRHRRQDRSARSFARVAGSALSRLDRGPLHQPPARLFPGSSQFHRPSHRLAAPAQAVDRRDRHPVALCRPREPGEARGHQDAGRGEGPPRFRARLSRTDQRLAVRPCARHLCANGAGGGAHPCRLRIFIGGLVMQRPARTKSVRPPKAENQANPNFRRDCLAASLALVTVVCLVATFLLSRDMQFLMPWSLASVHGAIENCTACHTKSGSGKLSWIHGLIAGDPRADSKACLTCHKMPKTAFNAHSASAEVLEESTSRLAKIAADTPQPLSARAQSSAFATRKVVARGLFCATCHKEHQGVHFNLAKISNEQCRSCDEVKFDSFDGHHPKFENYPFKRRTRIVYDHAGHFDKHFPEVAKKYPAKRIPDTCSTCHDSRNDERVMAVAPFDKTCTTCHLDQIVGKERASGPKGIAFLTLPGLDVKTLKEKNAAIGEWPRSSEAELSPFMKVMISRDERGRALIKAVDGVNLQDLSDANDDQIKAVTTLVWEIKRLFYALISGKASDVLADLNVGTGAKLSANLVADLTASIPRDVVISAQQEWLPNLATEMANGPKSSEPEQGGWSTAITASETASPEEPPDADAPEAEPSAEAEIEETASIAKLDPPVCTASILGQCLLFKEHKDKAEPAKAKAAEPEAAEETETANAEPDDAASGDEASEAKEDAPADAPADSGTTVAIDNNAANAAEPAGAEKTETANAEPGTATPSADEQPQVKAADQTDDLLFPTEEERRAIEAHNKRAEKAAQSGGARDLAD